MVVLEVAQSMMKVNYKLEPSKQTRNAELHYKKDRF